MGNSQSRSAETEVPRNNKEAPRKPQNKLSKPRTNTSTSNLLNNAPSAASRRNSQTVVPFAVPVDKRESFVTPEKPVVDSRASSRRNSLTTKRQRLRDHLFRSRSSDGRARASSVTSQSEIARDAAIARWSQSEAPSVKGRGDESTKIPELERQSRPTNRRASTAYTPYSHHASRLSLVAEAHTPEPCLEEASRRLERLQEISQRERSNSDASVIPIRRRSMLMTPGLATRRDSNGELLYEAFPVSRRLSATGTMGSRRSSWFDPSNPGLTSFAELPALEPPQFLQAMAQNDATPRAVTPSEQVVHLGAYKPGTLRITNADSSNHDEDTPEDLALEIPAKPLNSGLGVSPKSAQTLSPFSFEKSRSPSPQLQTTSKNTAVEDELFAEEELALEVVIGSPEHALRILDGIATADEAKPSFARSQTSPVRVLNSYGSLNNTMQGCKDYKPLTKNDSGYSSNVSLRSFKAQAEARAAAAKSNGNDASEESSKLQGETAQSNKDDEPSLALQNHSVNLATTNAPPPLSENSEDQKLDAAHASPTQGASMHWNRRPSLNISRKPSNSSPAETDSSMSPVSLLRRLTKNRPSSHPVVTVTSNQHVDSELIPPVSATASAQLEQRQIECPTLPHTYRSVSRTNSRETLTTILSGGDTVDGADEQRSFGFQHSSAAAPAHDGDDQGYLQLGYPPMQGKSKMDQRRMTSSNQSKVDFETHITSFGTVSESLGASPYDLAVLAMAPGKRSQSFQSVANDRLRGHNRSHSAHDLAPHNIRSPQPGVRKGMTAENAAQLARNKSRDREIGRRMSMEKLRDDRSALPSNRMTMRASPPVAAPMRSPHAQRRNSAMPSNTRTNPPPPVSMSSYRKSLPVQSPQMASSPMGSMSSQGSNVSYPQSGPWVPQRPQAKQYQSANEVPRYYETQGNNLRRPQSTRPSMENPATQNRSPYNYNNYHSSTPNNSQYQQAAQQGLDRYNDGYNSNYASGSRNLWTNGRAPEMDTGPSSQFDRTEVPVMIRG